MQKAIRNTSGKPVSVESLDKREEARHKPSANPVVKDEAKLDRDREAVGGELLESRGNHRLI